MMGMFQHTEYMSKYVADYQFGFFEVDKIDKINKHNFYR